MQVSAAARTVDEPSLAYVLTLRRQCRCWCTFLAKCTGAANSGAPSVHAGESTSFRAPMRRTGPECREIRLPTPDHSSRADAPTTPDQRVPPERIAANWSWLNCPRGSASADYTMFRGPRALGVHPVRPEKWRFPG